MPLSDPREFFRSYRLALPIGRIITTDTVAPRADLAVLVRVVSVAPLLSDVIARLDRDQSLGDLVSHG